MTMKETSGVHHWRDSSYRITGVFSFLSLSLSLSLSLIKSCLKDATVDRKRLFYAFSNLPLPYAHWCDSTMLSFPVLRNIE